MRAKLLCPCYARKLFAAAARAGDARLAVFSPAVCDPLMLAGVISINIMNNKPSIDIHNLQQAAVRQV